MLKHKRLKTVGFLALCLPLCGAWTAAPAEAAEEVYYTGAAPISSRAVETVQYTSRTIVENIATTMNVPEYYPLSEHENSCGAVSGATLVGFYDKYYTNMISDWDSYYSNGRYKSQDAVYVTALQKDLYNRMKINVSVEGVTESNFKSGLKSYVESKGYSVNYSPVWSSNSFNYDAFKTAVNNNELTALFVRPSNIYMLGGSNGYDSISNTYIPANHIMIGFGYYEVKYTLTSGGTRTDKYIKVASGIFNQELVLYKVGSYIDAAYTVKIS